MRISDKISAYNNRSGYEFNDSFSCVDTKRLVKYTSVIVNVYLHDRCVHLYVWINDTIHFYACDFVRVKLTSVRVN